MQRKLVLILILSLAGLFIFFIFSAGVIAQQPTEKAAVTVTYQKGVSGSPYDETKDTKIWDKMPTYCFVVDTETSIRSTPWGNGRYLIKFPNIIGANPGQIPKGSTITSATLSLFLRLNSQLSTLGAYKIKRHWIDGKLISEYDKFGHLSQGAYGYIDRPGEFGSTWEKAESYYSGEGKDVAWGAPGCNDPTTDRERKALSIMKIPAGDNWVNFDVTKAVQDWANGQPNEGIIIIAEPNNQIFIMYMSKHSDALHRPKLKVSYVGPSR
jgi:hypothetical protein